MRRWRRWRNAEKIDRAYGPQADAKDTMDLDNDIGDLDAIKTFASGQISDE